MRLPSGARAARCDCSGIVTKADAEAWMAETGPGGPLYDLPILAVALQLQKVESDARGVFGQHQDPTREDNWMAVVVTNPVIRVTTNFVMRITRHRKQRLFSTEAEAVAWLEERLREDSARRSAP